MKFSEYGLIDIIQAIIGLHSQGEAMSGVLVGLINNLQGETEGYKSEIIQMLNSSSREYGILNSLLDRYIESRDAIELLEKERDSKRD